MFKTELYKLFTRKIVLAGLALSMGFLLLSFWMGTLGRESVISDGRVWLRGEAIQRDKEICAPYEGALTMDKAMDIWDKYGPPVDRSVNLDLQVDLEKGTATEGYTDNFCNRFVEKAFFEKEYGNDGTVRYSLKPEKEVQHFLEPDLFFSYMGGWSGYWEAFFTSFILSCILAVIGTAPLFAEEYALKTADVALTTKNGRKKLFLCKMGAASVFGEAIYLIVCGWQFLLFASTYGTEGLETSAVFADLVWNFSGSLGSLIGICALCGIAALLGIVLITAAVSAVCRQTFTSLLWSLLLFLSPYVVVNILLSSVRPTFAARLITLLFTGMPFFFPFRFVEMLPYGKEWICAVVLALVSLVAWMIGKKKYCSHQV